MTAQPLIFHKKPVQVPWSCDGRGDCCRQLDAVTMTIEERDTLLAFVGYDRSQELMWRPDPTPNFVQLQARPCPLLDRDGQCSIYEVRPFNCRRFICGRVGDEEWESNADGSCHNLTVRLAQSRPFRRFYQLVQRRTSRWALQHGWKS